MSTAIEGESRVSTPAHETFVGGNNAYTIVLGPLQRLARTPTLRVVALIVLLTAGALREALRIAAFSDDSIWWHLRTGAWILQNHAIPRTGLFSQLPNSPWIAFSWPFDAAFAGVFAVLGLRAAPLMLMLFKVALAAITFLLAGGRQRFWCAVALSALAQFVFLNTLFTPMLISICCMGLAIYCLLESRRRGELRPLLWLPVLFWLWANLDARFILGFPLLAVFVVAEGCERILADTGVWKNNSERVPFIHLLMLAASCVAATELTPYTIHLIPSALQFVYSPTLFKNFAVMGAMDFRQPQHYVLLLLALSACLGLGRHRSHDLFKILMLMLCAALAFRIQADNWTIVLPSIAILAGSLGAFGEQYPGPWSSSHWKRNVLIGAGVTALLVPLYFHLPSNRVLEARLAQLYPARACKYIESNHLPSPIFDEYRWGGYVTWMLPEYPVSIDERINLYGNEESATYFRVAKGEQRGDTLPSFVHSQTFLLPAGQGMARAFTSIPELQKQFREVYRDDISAVFVRQ